MIARQPAATAARNGRRCRLCRAFRPTDERLVVTFGLDQPVPAEVLGRGARTGRRPGTPRPRRRRSGWRAAARRRTSPRSGPSGAPRRCRSSARRSGRGPRPRPRGPTGRRTARTRSRSQVAASPSGIGNVVRNPCTTSLPNSSGMPSRDSSRASSWQPAMVRGQVDRRRSRGSALAPCGVDARPHLAGGDLVAVPDRVQLGAQVELAGLLLQGQLGEQQLDPAARRRGRCRATGRARVRHPVSISTTTSRSVPPRRRSSARTDTPPAR